MSQLKPYKLELQEYLTYLFLTILFYHAFSSYSYNWLTLFNSHSDCTNFYSYYKTCNEASAEIETQVVIVETKISNCST